MPIEILCFSAPGKEEDIVRRLRMGGMYFLGAGYGESVGPASPLPASSAAAAAAAAAALTGGAGLGGGGGGGGAVGGRAVISVVEMEQKLNTMFEGERCSCGCIAIIGEP